MDIKMPEMDGYETTENIRKNMPASLNNIPIIALTAHTATWEAEKCVHVGMNDYITKPFNSKDLFNKIMKHTRNKKAKTNVSKQPDQTKVSALQQVMEMYKGQENKKHTDLSYLRDMANGNEAFVNKMVKTFIEEVTKDTQTMKTQLAEKDWKGLYGTAHKIKPSFHFMGISALKDVIITIENNAKDKTDLEKIPALVSEVVSIFNESVVELSAVSMK